MTNPVDTPVSSTTFKTSGVEVLENQAQSEFSEGVSEIPVVDATKSDSTSANNQVKKLDKFTTAVLSATETTASYFPGTAKPFLKKVQHHVLSNLDLNLRVVFEPRGFIRIFQIVTAIFAFATVVGFETAAKMTIMCRDFEKDLLYKIGYPFKMEQCSVRAPEKCDNISYIQFKTYKFPFDVSTNAEFFVATGVITVLFNAFVVIVYVFMHRLYSSNRMIAVVDLMTTGVLSIFWFAGSCAWAHGISDIKYHANPTNLFQYVDICKDPHVCQTLHLGNFIFLNASLIFGFANCLLCISSLWFIYINTCFYKKIPPPGMMPQMDMHQQQQVPPMQEQP